MSVPEPPPTGHAGPPSHRQAPPSHVAGLTPKVPLASQLKSHSPQLLKSVWRSTHQPLHSVSLPVQVTSCRGKCGKWDRACAGVRAVQTLLTKCERRESYKLKRHHCRWGLRGRGSRLFMPLCRSVLGAQRRPRAPPPAFASGHETSLTVSYGGRRSDGGGRRWFDDAKEWPTGRRQAQCRAGNGTPPRSGCRTRRTWAIRGDLRLRTVWMGHEMRARLQG
jgi:hypothetical protein